MTQSSRPTGSRSRSSSQGSQFLPTPGIHADLAAPGYFAPTDDTQQQAMAASRRVRRLVASRPRGAQLGG
jgi:hypothetical protein